MEQLLALSVVVFFIIPLVKQEMKNDMYITDISQNIYIQNIFSKNSERG